MTWLDFIICNLVKYTWKFRLCQGLIRQFSKVFKRTMAAGPTQALQLRKYFPEDEIRDILAARLQSGERALLRTDYTLDDDAFKAIAEETAQQTQLRLTGFHWMGVIYLEQR